LRQLKRWRKAQEYERSYWKKTADNIVKGSTHQLGWYEWKFNEMKKRLLPHLDRKCMNSFNTLEVGCGPIGIINYVNWGARYAIDPLEDFYKSNESLTKLRDSQVQYLVGTAELIPFDHEYFDLVIIDNVLDHVRNTNAVMSEIFRVLKRGGVLYLTLNIRTRFGTQFHRILSKLLIDKGHPESFSAFSIQSKIKQYQYILLSELISDPSEARLKDLRSKLIKDKIKGYAWLSEFLYYAVCRKIN
jgi:ubiquinone/menaquinone biosynthesis C-methylase UbiE